MKTEAGPRQYRQVARARARQRTRDALLDVAEREFLAGRWEQASLEALAASAGVTKQTLLRHFGSKARLLEHAVSRGRERVREQRLATPKGDVAAAVENLLDHYEEWGERALRIQAVEGGSAALTEIGRQARRVHYEWVEHAFAPWLDRLRGRHRARCRAALIALCDVHTWWLLSHDLGLPRSEVRAIFIQVIAGLIEEDK